MHDIIENELEDYLGGLPAETASGRFHAHLASCVDCREEVRAMREFSESLSLLKSPAPIEIAPGFHYRLMQRVEGQRKESFWSVFSFDPGFARRVVFSSLLTLAVMGGYLVSRENSFSVPDGPAVIMAQHDTSVPHDDTKDRGRMLVTLASYEH